MEQRKIKPAHEIAAMMLNVTCRHRAAGADQVWIDGMIKHWIGRAIASFDNDQKQAELMTALDDGVKPMLADYYTRHIDSVKDVRVRMDLLVYNFILPADLVEA